MAARFRTTLWTLTGGADSVEDIFPSPHDEYISNLTVRAGKGNVADVIWEDLDGSDGGYLQPKEAAEFNLDGKWVKTSQILFVGTVGDTIYATVIS